MRQYIKRGFIGEERQVDSNGFAPIRIYLLFGVICKMMYNYDGTLFKREVAKIKYGYVRVSTTGQKEDRQLDELLKYGIDLSCIYVDKQSGKGFKGPQYIKLYKKIPMQ